MSNPREHLAYLHRAIGYLEYHLRGYKKDKALISFMEEAREHLHTHQRKDADFGDLGRPLKDQYEAKPLKLPKEET